MILFFSGTGNSRYAALQIAKVIGDEVVSINENLRCRNLDAYNARYAFESEKPFVIVCPTYCWHIPRVVEDFLYGSRFLGSDEMYFVLTCGDSTGAADKHAAMICKKLEMQFMGLASTKMPENYITMFKAPEADEAVGIVRAAQSQVESFARSIQYHRKLEDGNSSRPVPEFVYNGFYNICMTDKKFRVEDSCVGCGKCAAACPMGNISMADGRPQWFGNCTQCQACISICPYDAIEYGKKTKGKRRYYLFEDGRQKFPIESPKAE